jgi:hypothetical protein
MMKGLLKTSKEEKTPIEIMYISSKGDISHRNIIVMGNKKNILKHFACVP